MNEPIFDCINVPIHWGIALHRTSKSRQELANRQIELMLEHRSWESMQTDCSYDVDFYKFCQWKMDLLDEEAEQIRHVLEMGCVE